MLIFSTTTRSVSGIARVILPRWPLFLPEITSTSSPVLTCIVHLLNATSVRRGCSGVLASLPSLHLDPTPCALQRLRRQRHDLHERFVAELAGNWPKDAGAPRIAVRPDQDGGIVVETNMRAVSTAIFFGCPDDDRTDNLAFLGVAAGIGILDRCDDHIADRAPADA